MAVRCWHVLETNVTSSNYYVLKEDIVIRAGTRLYTGPSKEVYYTPHLEIGVAFGKDVTATLRVDLEEAVESGLVQRGAG